MINMVEEQLEKKWWTSKTIWSSVIVVLLGVLTWIQGQVDAGLPITLVGVLMAILRTMTSKKLVK